MHPIWTLLRCIAAASLTFFIAASALAQTRDSAEPGVRPRDRADPGTQPRAVETDAHERIVLDGRLDETAWQRAPLHERFVQYLPTDRQPPPPGYRTTV